MPSGSVPASSNPSPRYGRHRKLAGTGSPIRLLSIPQSPIGPSFSKTPPTKRDDHVARRSGRQDSKALVYDMVPKVIVPPYSGAVTGLPVVGVRHILLPAGTSFTTIRSGPGTSTVLTTSFSTTTVSSGDLDGLDDLFLHHHGLTGDLDGLRYHLLHHHGLARDLDGLDDLFLDYHGLAGHLSPL